MTASLDLCRRLAELGVVIETDFYWYKQPMDKDYKCVFIGKIYHKNPFDEYVFAPSTDELLAVMPEKFPVEFDYVLNGTKPYQVKTMILTVWDVSYTDALAKVIIYLLENGYHFEKGMVVR